MDRSFGRTELSIMDHGSMENAKGMAGRVGLTAKHSKVNSKMIQEMALEK